MFQGSRFFAKNQCQNQNILVHPDFLDSSALPNDKPEALVFSSELLDMDLLPNAHKEEPAFQNHQCKDFHPVDREYVESESLMHRAVRYIELPRGPWYLR